MAGKYISCNYYGVERLDTGSESDIPKVGRAHREATDTVIFLTGFVTKPRYTYHVHSH